MTCDGAGHFFIPTPGRLFPGGGGVPNIPELMAIRKRSFGPKNQKNSAFNECGDYRPMYLNPSFGEEHIEKGISGTS